MTASLRLLACALLLGACSSAVDPARPEPGGPDPDAPPRAAAFDRSLDRAVERSLLERPFARGPLVAVAVEGGELLSFAMGPCPGGSASVAICEGGPGGPRGTVRRTPDHLVVEGLHGRRFYLSNGGDGFAERGGHLVPLAWDARTNGTGFGLTPAIETAAPHD